MVKKYLLDWRAHVIALLFVLLAEAIGVIPIALGPVKFSLLPMLYVLVFGIVLGATKVIPKQVMKQAAPCISIATMWLIVKLSATIGPNLQTIIQAGPALILQEFGNLGTIFLSVPIAVFVFKMGRQAVGAGFSNSREGSIALVGNMYGLDGPEGQGVMGAYMTGTILGAIFFSILSSIAVMTNLFHPYSLAMAAGTGSASMMAASVAPIIEAYPEMEQELSAFAASSNLLSTVDGLYMSLFLGIPLTNWLYKVLKGPERFKKAEEKRAAKRAAKLRAKGITVEEITPVDEAPAPVEKQSYGVMWIHRGKILVFSAILMLLANWVNTMRAGSAVVTPLAGLPGILLMAIPIVLGYFIFDLLAKKVPKLNMPALLYTSVIGIVMSIPGVPFSEVFVAQIDLFGVLAMCTPVLAYAGVSVGQDLKGFRRQGIAIVCIALIAFIGTYIGSAIISQVVLNLTGAI